MQKTKIFFHILIIHIQMHQKNISLMKFEDSHILSLPLIKELYFIIRRLGVRELYRVIVFESFVFREYPSVFVQFLK